VTGSLFQTSDWQTAKFQWIPLGVTMQSDDHFEFDVFHQLDAPADTFPIYPGFAIAPGRYWWTRGQFLMTTSAGRPLSLTAIASTGGFYDGTETEVTLEGTWREGSHLVLASGVDRSRVSLPSGGFTAEQVTGRIEYAFNPRTDFLGFVQYNGEARRIDFNLRFHWIPTIGDDLYIVWNSGYTTDPSVPYRFPDAHVLGRPLNGGLVIKAVHRIVP
jgi:hypothetical protein